MLRKSSILALSTAVALAACAGKQNNQYIMPGGGGQNGPSQISKDTKTQAAVNSIDDQFNLALNEIGWTRQHAALALNPPTLSSKEDCVTHMPSRNKSRAYLSDSYTCARDSDASDSIQNREYDFSGSTYYALQGLIYHVNGSYQSKIYTQAVPPVLVAHAVINRDMMIAAPSGVTGTPDSSDVDLASSLFSVSSHTTYSADVPAQSNHKPESYDLKYQGGFQSSTSQAVTFVQGGALTFAYTPEIDPTTTKSTSQTLKLTATSNITFTETSDGCLRPVGTFSWTMGQGGAATAGTLTATATGYTRSDVGTATAWSKRCLQR